MITHPAFSVEPWAVRERGLDLDLLGQSESVFALANGHIGLRGNLDEGEPFALPGSYLNAFYEVRPLPYAETAYGLPDAGQTIVNVTNGSPSSRLPRSPMCPLASAKTDSLWPRRSRSRPRSRTAHGSTS